MGRNQARLAVFEQLSGGCYLIGLTKYQHANSPRFVSRRRPVKKYVVATVANTAL